MLKIYFCADCHENIERGHETFFKVYEFFCTHYLINGDYFERKIHNEDDISVYTFALDFLEKSGFILSTESGTHSVKIKPLGHIVNESGDTHLFCIDRSHLA